MGDDRRGNSAWKQIEIVCVVCEGDRMIRQMKEEGHCKQQQ